MRKQRIAELDKLFHEIGTYRKSSEFKELLDFIKRFPHIAPYNAMLIHIQKPGSRYVASASDWLSRFGRHIKVGARPLVILRAFGPVSFVFELSDTYGDSPFPEELINPFKTNGKVSEISFKQLIKNLKNDEISYNEVLMGSTRAGFIKTTSDKQELKIEKQKKEIWVKVLYEMLVNGYHEVETKLATIAHELGHLYCGHLGTPNPKWWKDRKGLPLNVREFEAESVCWLVCERMGIKNPSAGYLSGYLDENDKIPNISIDTVLKAAAIIESMIQSNKEPRKEIILSTNELLNIE